MGMTVYSAFDNGPLFESREDAEKIARFYGTEVKVVEVISSLQHWLNFAPVPNVGQAGDK